MRRGGVTQTEEGNQTYLKCEQKWVLARKDAESIKKEEIKDISSMNTKRCFHKWNSQHQEGHFNLHILSVNENEFQKYRTSRWAFYFAFECE